MPQCSEIGLMLSAASDGELEPPQLREVVNHLERCASCTGELSDYSRIGRELKSIAVMPSLERFTRSVLDLIGKLIIVVIIAAAVHAFIAGQSNVNIARAVRETVAARPSTSSNVAPSTGIVEVRVDSALVAGTDESGSFSHRYQQTKSGRLIVFKLQGGKTLLVQPRAIDGGMIALQVVLFDGGRPTMTANLNVESGETFALTGQQSSEGTLLLRISPIQAATASTDPKLL
jgi:hypothetical protein